MKVSLLWLKDFLDLPASVAEVAEALTLLGLEVEGEEARGDDTIFDVSLTPNLGHCMSMLGVARELAAHFEVPFQLPKFSLEEAKEHAIQDAVNVKVENSDACPRYTARVIEGIKVGPSPKWLVDRLEASGLRSINNIVDVTNYVMLELGQPLHAFDLDKIDERTVLVTSTASHQEMHTLDDIQRDLPPDALLICDPKRPLAIGGVMGGNDSAVTDNTTRILLESACFSPQSVRKTSKWLGLRTDSSIRFEKGIDPTMVPFALDRAASLLKQVGGGVIYSGSIDVCAHGLSPRVLACRTTRVNALLGTQLSQSEIVSFLTRLGFELVKEEEDTVHVKVPLYRNDVSVEIDLVEEVARIYGFNNIPQRPEKYATPTIPDAPIYVFEKEIREGLLNEGLGEWITCDLISPKLAALSQEKPDSLVTVLKPASSDQSVLRPSLLPSMLDVVKHNIDRGTSSLASFEIGRIHYKNKEGFVEESCAAVLLTGESRPYHWHPKPTRFDFFDLKGIVENVLGSLRIEALHFEVSHRPQFHPKRQAAILADQTVIGIIGELHPGTLRQLDIEQRVLFAEINLHLLFKAQKKSAIFEELPLYPASTRDLTVTVQDSITFEELRKTVLECKCPYLESITFLDLYKSEQIGKDRKNVTLRFVYRDRKKTIALETVDKQHQSIADKVAKAFT